MTRRNKHLCLSVLAFLGVWGSSAFAGGDAVEIISREKKIEKSSLIEKVLRTYSSATTVDAEIEKQLVLPLLNRVRTQKGRLYMRGAEQLRLEMEDPKTLAVLNSTKLWVVDFPQSEDQKIHVVVTKITKKSQSHVLITNLLAKGSLLKVFKNTGEKVDGIVHTIDLMPRRPSDQFTRLQLVLEKQSEAGVLKSLTYWDALENETRFLLKKAEFNKKLDPKLFSYEVPKGAEVLEESL